MFRSRSKADEPQEKISGTVAKIVFAKDGFAIMRLADRTSVKGNITNPAVGLEYVFHGTWDDSDDRWGPQFCFVAYHAVAPSGFEAIAAYLDANAKWIGPDTAKALVNLYGQDALRTLKDDPERVAREIRGITGPRALEISQMLRDNEAEEELQIALNELFVGTGISKWISTQAIKEWGSDAPAKISANPFILTTLSGCGFLLADRVRMKLGIPHDSPDRIQAGILHVLNEKAWGDGHTYLPACEFFSETIKILDVENSQVAKQAVKLTELGSIVIGHGEVAA